MKQETSVWIGMLISIVLFCICIFAPHLFAYPLMPAMLILCLAIYIFLSRPVLRKDTWDDEQN